MRVQNYILDISHIAIPQTHCAVLPLRAERQSVSPDHMSYWLYIAECADGTLYTGIATDVPRRICEHNGQASKGARGKGARYTAARRPVVLAFQAPFATRSEASKEEARIKRLTRNEKVELIARARAKSS
jgi:putative endonuclease